MTTTDADEERDVTDFVTLAASILASRDEHIGAGMIRAFVASLRSTSQAGGVPAGWRVVPVEPTQEMLDACNPYSSNRSTPSMGADALRAYVYGLHADGYQAMLSASPPPPPTVDGGVPATTPQIIECVAKAMFNQQMEAVGRRVLWTDADPSWPPLEKRVEVRACAMAAVQAMLSASPPLPPTVDGMREALARCVRSIRSIGNNLAEFDSVTDSIFWDELWEAEDIARAALASSPTTDPVAVEREACAKLADSFDGSDGLAGMRVCDRIASAIRARGTDGGTNG